ncbi:hypothetical protein GCM10020254_45820 [Streptomyces goshikiensis]
MPASASGADAEEGLAGVSPGAVACQDTTPKATEARATPAQISRGLREEEDIRVLQGYG